MRWLGTSALGLLFLAAAPQSPDPELASISTTTRPSLREAAPARYEAQDASPNPAFAQPTVAASASPEAAASQDPVVANLRLKVERLEAGVTSLAQIASYRATLQKQEVVGGNLLDEQTIELKCRHEPFSVYLVWTTGDAGREVLYVHGENDGKLIAHDGGWKARIPAFSLAVDSPLALRDSRYPVTQAGLLNLARTMLDIHREDLQRNNVLSCELTPGTFDGRDCLVFTTVYKSAETSPVYRKSITSIDREWNLPISTVHYEWPAPDKQIPAEELDQHTLIESYSFRGIELTQDLTARDFDRTNNEYRFR